MKEPKGGSAGNVYLKSFMLNLKGEHSLVFVYRPLCLVHFTLAGGRRLDGPGTVVRFPIGIDVSLPKIIQNGCGPHLASCPMGKGSFPGSKELGPEADISPPTSAEIKR